MIMVAAHLFHLPLPPPPPSSSLPSTTSIPSISAAIRHRRYHQNISSFIPETLTLSTHHFHRRNRKLSGCNLLASKEDTTELSVTPVPEEEDEQELEEEPTPEDLEYVRQIKRVLELLKKNRDMLFSEVKLTIMIEDPRDVERRRLLGIEDPDTPTREELADALDEVNEGKVPEDRFALRILAEEMTSWPNLEVEPIKKKPSKSLYAKATDTGVNPQVAAKRLNIDWDSAAEIDDSEVSKESDVPSVVGYGALYLVTAFPVIIASPITNTTTKTADQFYYQADGSFNERQISFDSTSLLRQSSTDMGSPRVQLKPVVTDQNTNGMCPLLPLLSPKSKFLSASLPNSVNSSPRFNTSLVKKNQRNHRKTNYSPARHHSPVYSVIRQESYLSRSMSCGDGRSSAPSDEFDLCTSKLNRLKHGSFNNKTEADEDGENVNHSRHKSEEFKCGKMCLFLPGFGKGKPVVRQTRKEVMEVQTMISERISLEMFECGSWSSSAIANDSEENGHSVNLYVDLPLEPIPTTVNDAHSPVRAAFVFHKDRKGGLKNRKARSGGATKSSESGRRVRFSTSNPQSCRESPNTVITPRLRKARADFNAFLEAQSAS